MPKKLSEKKITLEDVREYAKDYSDFAFELRVLQSLEALGFHCTHGGIYSDPVTQIPRQYDIRAYKQVDSVQVCLAVECKNIRENFPIVAHRIPRQAHEAYHQLIISYSKASARNDLSIYNLDPLADPGKEFTIPAPLSLYKEGDMVVKSTDQVGRAEHKEKGESQGAIVTGDREFYDKAS